MKKIYTLALAALCALSASAATKSLASGQPLTRKATISADVKEVTSIKKIKKAPAKAPAIDGLEDATQWNYYGMLDGNSGYKSANITIAVEDDAAGTVSISLPQGFSLEATYDVAAGTLTIEKQLLGQDEDGDIFFYVKDVDEDYELIDGESATKTAAVGTFDGESVVFDELEVWAVGDPNNEAVGWYVLCAENEFTVPEPEPELIDLGEAEFLENICYKTFAGEENTTVSILNIKTDGEGTYYLEDPLQALYAVNGWNAESPTMTIDATDPENVKIPFTATGLANSGNPYIYFSESYYSDLTGEALDEEFIIKKEVEGNKVTITIPFHATTVWLYNTQSFYYGSAYVSTLTFTEESAGVDNVAVDNENAPVEYFNLLGNRVTNPAKGQLIIKKQGSVVTKLVVK